MRRCYFLAAALLLAAAAVPLAACGGADGEAAPRFDVGQIEEALRGAGLEICGSAPAMENEGAEGEHVIEVALSCADEEDATVVDVIDWPDEEARDHALRRFEAQDRPPSRNHGITWALGTATVHVSGPRDDEAVERVAAAMEQLGAG